MDRYLPLKDDGSVGSDRALLLALNIADRSEAVKAHRKEAHVALPVPKGVVLADAYTVDDLMPPGLGVGEGRDVEPEGALSRATKAWKRIDTLTNVPASDYWMDLLRFNADDTLWSIQSMRSLADDLSDNRRGVFEKLIDSYPNLNEDDKYTFRKKMKLLQRADTINGFIEKRDGVLPEALKYDYECMDQRHPCLRGEHKRK